MTENAIEHKVSLGQRIKAARRDARMTTTTLAYSLGVDPRTVARWQSDEADPSIERLAQIARVLDKPPSYFLDGIVV